MTKTHWIILIAALLAILNRLTENYGARIPTNFWDALSDFQVAQGEDVYTQAVRFAVSTSWKPD